MMPPTYATHPHDYLIRAKKALAAGEGESFFYVALEIRNGIEARMKDYLRASDEILKAKKHGWEIPKMAKDLEAAFRIGNKIACVKFVETATGKDILHLFYSPVSKRAQKVAGRMGDYLHSGVRKYTKNEEWWCKFKELLEEGIDQLENCVSGSLMAAPLHNYSNGKFWLMIDPTDGHAVEILKNILLGQIHAEFHVDYLDVMPTIKTRRKETPPEYVTSQNNASAESYFLSFTFQIHFRDPGDEIFAERQKAGENNLKTPEGKDYYNKIIKYLANAFQKGFPKEFASPLFSGLYHFNAAISKDGTLEDPAIRPLNEASERMVRYFSASKLPIPPNIGRNMGRYTIGLSVTVE